MNVKDVLRPDLSEKDYLARYDYVHRKVYANPSPDFDSVTKHIYRAPDGYYTADHCLIHDGAKWHLFYVTGEINVCNQWTQAYANMDREGLKKYQYEAGDGHAIGTTLDTLTYQDTILPDSIGDIDAVTRGNTHIVRYKDHWVALYQVRGIDGPSICSARSYDLYTWKTDDNNPVFRSPDWAYRLGQCKDIHIVPWRGVYLVYYITQALDGLQTIALKVTENFEQFIEVGPVFKGPNMARGTRGMESPCIVERNNMWHLFFGWGIYGVWHVMSRRPDTFTGVTLHDSACDNLDKPLDYGMYAFAPFHAAEIMTHDGEWFATTTIKEELRRKDCENRILKYRGTLEDEMKLTHGIYMSRIIWDQDYPVCHKP